MVEICCDRSHFIFSYFYLSLVDLIFSYYAMKAPTLSLKKIWLRQHLVRSMTTKITWSRIWGLEKRINVTANEIPTDLVNVRYRCAEDHRLQSMWGRHHSDRRFLPHNLRGGRSRWVNLDATIDQVNLFLHFSLWPYPLVDPRELG